VTETLELEFPLMRYDITMPLLEGRVPIEGVTLKPVRTPAMVTSADMPFRDGRFGLADLNWGYLLPAVEAGWELVALPVFSKRKPVYGFVFCRADAGIESPRDLEGKRIGSRQYRTAITVWLRGFLRHRHGVDVARLRWVVSVDEVFPVHDPEARIERAADPAKGMVDCLLDGEVDAIITDISDMQLFERLETSPSVKRLFPDYMAEDERLYRETGIYTPVHLIVMSKALERAHPELAGKLYAAFEQAKALAYRDILSDQGGFSVVYLRERLKEQQARWGEPWQYGLAANKSTIDTFFQFNVEQGMVRAAPSYDQVFARSTLET
jgi:4,5-dihydroxyphthalate decarboxylase